jgi:hypothetical protein
MAIAFGTYHYAQVIDALFLKEVQFADESLVALGIVFRNKIAAVPIITPFYKQGLSILMESSIFDIDNIGRF